jgi:hypothetical protein
MKRLTTPDGRPWVPNELMDRQKEKLGWIRKAPPAPNPTEGDKKQ